MVNNEGDEFGGDYRPNDEQNRAAFQAARANVASIKEWVARDGGASSERTEKLVLGAMEKMSGRAPFGHLTDAFAKSGRVDVDAIRHRRRPKRQESMRRIAQAIHAMAIKA